MKSKILKLLGGILIAIFFLYLTLRNQPVDEIFKVVLNAKLGYIFLAFVFYFLSYIARSEKWRIQLDNVNLKVPSLKAFYAIMMHYFADSFTVKFGVVVRCLNLKKNTDVKFAPCIGTCISEAIFDIIFLFLGILIVLIIRFENVSEIFLNLYYAFDFQESLSNPGNIFLIVIAVFFVIVFSIFLFRKGSNIKKYKEKIREFINVLKKTFNIKRFWAFFVWNIMLWAMLYLMNLFLYRALFDNEISFFFIYSLTTFTYLAWLLPNPGGIGSVEYFALQAFLLFGFAEQSAIAFGFLSNGFTLFANLFFGFVLIIINKLFGLFADKNIKPIAEE